MHVFPFVYYTWILTLYDHSKLMLGSHAGSQKGDGRFVLLLHLLSIRGQCSVLSFSSQGHELAMNPLPYQITITAP